ncbi:hypothetical protein MSPP1_003309 [Malassezia sp. CBS 17886]|nr:hypothetical protein MSPP1_003309 [Malassezia sp. CBS 17886]
MEHRVPVADGISLSARIHSPQTGARGLAVVAHPYGFVGGTQDDPVVQQLVHYFLHVQRVHVVTYNQRGVKASGGRVTWTMRRECDDYQAVVDAMLQHLRADARDAGAPTVFLCVRARAVRLTAGVQCGGDAVRARNDALTSSAATAVARPAPDSPWAAATTRHVLIAYPVGVAWLLTCLRAAHMQQALDARVRAACAPPHAPSHAVLCVWMTQDQFTSPATYEKWCAALRAVGASADGAGRGGQGAHPGAPTRCAAALRTASLRGDHFLAAPAQRAGLERILHVCQP